MDSLIYDQVVLYYCKRVGVSQNTIDSTILLNTYSGVIPLDIDRTIIIKKPKGFPLDM